MMLVTRVMGNFSKSFAFDFTSAEKSSNMVECLAHNGHQQCFTFRDFSWFNDAKQSSRVFKANDGHDDNNSYKWGSFSFSFGSFSGMETEIEANNDSRGANETNSCVILCC